MIKINTSGDYVQLIYVDAVGQSVQQELKSDTDAFECSYDSEGKLYMQFGLMRFENPDPTDFTINDVAVTDAADFISKLNALFTGGGGGGGSIPNPLTGNVEIGLAGHELSFEATGGEFSVEANGNPNFYVRQNGGDALLQGFNTTGSGNYGRIFFNVLAASSNAFFDTNFNDGTKSTSINAASDSTTATITYTADTHTFNGTVNLPTQAAPSAPNDGDIWREDNTNTGLKIRINGVTKTITVS